MSLPKTNRRSFLSLTSATMCSVAMGKAFSNTETASAAKPWSGLEEKPQPINAISIGYYNPGLEPFLKVESLTSRAAATSQEQTEIVRMGATRRDLLNANEVADRLSRGAKKLVPQEAKDLDAPSGFTFKNNIKNARYLEKGDPAFLEKKARVDFNGMFATKDNWTAKDQGTLIVKIGFDKFKNQQTCQEIESATTGDNFVVSVINSIVPAFSADQIVVDSCGVKGGLKLSFNLVDVFDKTDRNLAGKILAAVKSISDFHSTGKIVNAFLPYVTAASTILDIFGIDVLNTSEENKQLWSFTQQAVLETGNQSLRHKLLPGFYFIGGFSKYEKENGSADGLPNWRNYMVNGPDGPGGGNPFLLYRKKVEDGKEKLMLVDFSYLVLGVAYA